VTDQPTRFDLPALYRAIDSKRLRRRLKWPAVAEGIGLPLKTIQNTRYAGVMEADGVLAMVRWLGVPPETFVRPEREGPYPSYMSAGTIWRVDATALHARLVETREARGLTWKALARELGDGVAPSSLTRLKDGGRVSIYLLAAASAWLDEPIEAFTRVVEGD
jgi:hypothetical protein